MVGGGGEKMKGSKGNQRAKGNPLRTWGVEGLDKEGRLRSGMEGKKREGKDRKGQKKG